MSEPQLSPDLPPLSVVVPVCDEAGAVETLLRELLAAAGDRFDLEVVVVDDGSRDGSDAIVGRLADAEPRLRLIRHPGRAGKSAALATGMRAARGPWVATIDADGENAPDDLVRMAGEIDPTAVGRVGLVCGIRRRRTAGASRLIASRIANAVRRAALRDDCPDTACGLKVIPRDLFLALPFFDGLHRYLPALVRHHGFESRNVAVDDRPRRAGASKYTNLGRALVGVVDLLGVMWLLRRTSIGAPAVGPRAEGRR